jgi:membrane-associated protease RseP (regulator of RpoE activity)
MVSFFIYDLIFLIAFTIIVALFLYSRRKNLQRQGLLYLYRTKVGIKFIEWTSRKFPKTLYVMQYLVVASGYALMAGMVYMLIRFSYFYITSPGVARAIKVPVIIPLIPYLPRIFNLDFLPPLYFTYWIVILIIIAVPHEFAHGIFARLNKIRIHSTGFGFLGPFLAAFVEPDEKQMEKAKKFPQLSILAAGTFANVVFTVIFSLIFFLFFVSAFTPAGVIFNTYASNIGPVSAITSVDGIPITNLDQIPSIIEETQEFVEIQIDNQVLFAYSSQLLYAVENNIENIPVVLDSPAFQEKLSGAIIEIDGTKIASLQELRSVLDGYSPGDKITISTLQDNEEVTTQEITLADFEGEAFLGIGIIPPNTSNGLMGKIYGIVTKVKDPSIYYNSALGDLGIFIYNLLWWSILISISVALVNMLPLGIFDGGRFFYLTVWAITGSQSIGKKAYKISTYSILLLIVALMVKWVLAFT